MSRRATLAVLAAALGLACESAPEPGRLAVTFVWESPPDSAVFLWMRVEHRPDPAVPGPVLASAGPIQYLNGDRLELPLSDVPNGADRRVVVEVREAADPNLPVLYYGMSAAFSMAPGKRTEVSVDLALQAPRIAEESGSVALLFDGEPRPRITLGQAQAATVRIRSRGATAFLVANDTSFSRHLRTYALDDPGLYCADEVTGEESWQLCDIAAWDLTAGEETPAEGLHVLPVYVKIVDAYGYPSAVRSTSAVLDREAPAVLAATLEPKSARAGQEVVLTVSLQEPLAEDQGPPTGGELVVEPAADLDFGEPQRVQSTHEYFWTAVVPATEQEDLPPYAFSVRLRDPYGNATGPIPLVDAAHRPLALEVDGARPRLVAPPVAPAEGWRFGLRGPSDRPAQTELAFELAFEERHAPLTPADGCDQSCPEVYIDRRRVGTVSPLPTADDPDRHAFRFRYEVEPPDWAPVDREYPLLVRWWDRAGNVADVDLPSSVRFDFVRPGSVRCVLTPARANEAATFTYSVSVTEPLGTPPVPEVGSVNALFTGPPRVTDDGHTFTWTQAAAGLRDETFTVAVPAWDTTGNAAGDALCRLSAAIDASPPSVSRTSLAVQQQEDGAALGTPLVARDGDTLIARFRVEGVPELGAIEPVVQLAASAPVPLEGRCAAAADGVGAFDCAYTLAISVAQHAALEGSWPLRVEVADGADNRRVELLRDGALVGLDFTAPGAACAANPAGRPLAGGERLTLVVDVSEPQAPGYPRTESEGIELAVESATDYRTRFIGAGAGTGEFSYRVLLLDRAGNPGLADCPNAGRIDGEHPTVRAGSVSVTDRETFKIGDELHVAFDASEPLGAPPAVTVGGVPFAAVEGDPDRPYAYRHVVGAEGDEDGLRPVVIDLVDQAGNAWRDRTSVRPVVFDVTRPIGDCRAVPGDRPVGRGESVRVAVDASEPQAPGFPELDPPGDFAVESRSLLNTVFAAPGLAEPGHEASYQVEVVLRDRAGNLGAAPCLATWSVDTIDPAIVAGSVRIEGEAPFTVGEQIRIEFEVDEPGVQATVRVGGGAAELVATDGQRRTLAYTVPPDAVEGPNAIVAGLTDAAGNVAEPVELATAQFDLTPPALAATPRFERCDDYAPASEAPNDLWVRPGLACAYAYRPAGCDLPGAEVRAPIRVTFTLAEPVREASVRLLVADRPPADPPELVIDRCASTDTRLVALYGPDGDGARGECTPVVADVEDVAGNRAQLALGCLRLDDEPPAAPDVGRPGRVIYVRDPVGAERAGTGVPRFAVRGEPGAAEPNLTVEILTSQPRSVIAAETSDADGAFDIELDPADRETVLVSATDRAGNRSEPAVVRDVEWHTTLDLAGGVRRGSSNRIERRGNLAAELVQEDEGVSDGAVAALTGVDDVVLEAVGRGWWSGVFASTPPAARSGHAVAYDTAAGELLLFGGRAGGEETWRWDSLHRSWAQMPPAPLAGRSNHALVYDPSRDVVVLFGGRSNAESCGEGTGAWCGYTWEWSRQEETWLTVATTGPSPRAGHALAYDPRGRRVMLFGGENADAGCGEGAGDLCAHTWEWDGRRRAWRRVARDGPSARTGHAQAWSPASQAVVMFGGAAAGAGCDEGAGDRCAYTWAWERDRHAWRRIAEAGPPGRSGHGMARAGAGVLLFGGFDDDPEGCGAGAEGFCADTWMWTGDGWRAVEGAGPDARRGAAMACDVARDRVLLFGGEGPEVGCGSGCADLWAWDADDERWHSLDAVRPSARDMAAMAYDRGQERVVLFGGTSGANETWEWDGRFKTWSLAADSGPAGRARHAMAYDESQERVILFGGRRTPDCEEGAGERCAYTWAWDGERRAWEQLAVDGATGRYEHGMVYNGATRRVLMLGGYALGDPLRNLTGRETWAWEGREGTWTVASEAGPTTRAVPGLAYDPVRARVVLFGGNGAAGDGQCHEPTLQQYCAYTWEWDGAEATWTRVATSGPTRRGDAQISYDLGRRRVTLIGGHNTQGDRCAEGAFIHCPFVWEWDGRRANWQRVATSGPAPRALQRTAYDAVSGKTVMFGGTAFPEWISASCGEGAGRSCTYTWEWDGGSAARPALVAFLALADAREGRPPDVEAVTAHWKVGGVGYDEDGAARRGVDLLVWDQGAWRSAASHEADPDAPDWLSWTTADASEAERLLVGSDDSLVLAVAPSAPNGPGSAAEGDDAAATAYARVAADYVEAVIRYRKAAPEACEAGAVEACGGDQGICTPGWRRCAADGAWAPCDGVSPTEEICNGIDDDCDGAVDDVEPPCGGGP